MGAIYDKYIAPFVKWDDTMEHAEMNQNANIKSKWYTRLLLIIVLCIPFGLFLWQKNANDHKTQISSFKQTLDEEVLAKWGKPFSELPTENLIIVSPHNDAIRDKFKRAFVRYYAVEKGKHVLIWWHYRSGSNAILDFLMDQKQKPPVLDVVFGGGEYLFERLAAEEMLLRMEIEPDVLKQIPSEFAGVRLYDPQLRWCGNVLSGFGFLFNKAETDKLGIKRLNTWQDLAQPRIMDHLVIADPAKSGSSVAAFEMILQSEPDWPSGWRTLLNILSNTKEFMPNSDDAANAPLFDQAAVAICIDFYGISRQTVQPERIEYVSPKGQTALTPDPIAILTDAPNKEIAQAFVNFVLSEQGQALWGKKAEKQGEIPIYSLYRTPIRKDFYNNPADIPESIRNPYIIADIAYVDSQLQLARFGVLRQLVNAAVIENFSDMKKAKKKLIESNFQSSLADEFFELPDNIDTVEKIQIISEQLKDPEKVELITDEWAQFFKQRYSNVLQQ